jgi:hypothetical protein
VSVVGIIGWPARRWLVSIVVAVATALVIGIPTGIIATPFYTRMTPVLWWNPPVWAATSVLAGLVSATYVRSALPARRPGQASVGASLLSLFAVGCPICNKLVVAAIGVSGALNVWAPIQPILAVLSLVALAASLAIRLRGEQSCPVSSSSTAIRVELDGRQG